MPMVRKDLRKIYTIQVELLGLPQPKFVPMVAAPAVMETASKEVKAAEPPVISVGQVPQEETPVRRPRRRRKDMPRTIPRLEPTQMSSLIDLVLSLEEPRRAIELISTIREEFRRAEERLADCESREWAKIGQIEEEIARLLTA